MIFVTVGTQVQPFDRLINEVKKLETKYQFIVQSGTSKIKLTTSEQFSFGENLQQKIEECELLITHGGVGTIMEALALNKKIIVVPRLKVFGEHIDDHQMEICTKLETAGYLMFCHKIELLESQIEAAKEFEFKKFKSNTNAFLNKLEQIIEGKDD
ncbi:MAG: PssE/Cps14G family polysaccharide biosynthesis glycosyltransferase [Mycoplasmatales bacterium]